MMEQPNTLLNKRKAQLLRRIENSRVVLTAAGRGDVSGAGTGGAEDVVYEWEL